MPGSWTSLKSNALISWRICSPTRSGRVPWGMSAKELHLALRDEIGLEPLDLRHDRRERLFGDRIGRGHRHHRQSGALPDILMGDLGDGDIERAQSIFQPPQYHSLVLQGLRRRKVELEGEQSDCQREPTCLPEVHALTLKQGTVD